MTENEIKTAYYHIKWYITICVNRAANFDDTELFLLTHVNV